MARSANVYRTPTAVKVYIFISSYLYEQRFSIYWNFKKVFEVAYLSLCAPGRVEIELIFALRAAVSEIQHF